MKYLRLISKSIVLVGVWIAVGFVSAAFLPWWAGIALFAAAAVVVAGGIWENRQ